jgi:hypothetical protein
VTFALKNAYSDGDKRIDDSVESIRPVVKVLFVIFVPLRKMLDTGRLQEEFVAVGYA